MSDLELRTKEILHQMLSQKHIKMMLDENPPQGFAAEIPQLALDNVYASLWARPGLDLRAKSILTLGMLIALRASGEMAMHFPSAVRNGVTIEEIEEIIYLSTAYAGFPAGVNAREIAEKSLREAGMLE